MKRELHHRYLARLFVWQLVASAIVGWNVSILTEMWTNWNIVSFACQFVLLLFGHRGIAGFEDSVTRCISYVVTRFEK
jgi:hypothetical protein